MKNLVSISGSSPNAIILCLLHTSYIYIYIKLWAGRQWETVLGQMININKNNQDRIVSVRQLWSYTFASNFLLFFAPKKIMMCKLWLLYSTREYVQENKISTWSRFYWKILSKMITRYISCITQDSNCLQNELEQSI